MIDDARTWWYNISATAGLGPAAAQKIARHLRATGNSIADLRRYDRASVEQIGLSASVAAALQRQLAAPIAPPDASDGLELLVPGDAGYPNLRFIDANPPLPVVLWASGNTELLNFPGPSLAVAGSRDADDGILEWVEALAVDAGRAGWLVVSGLAKGVDSAAHRGALAGPVGTVGVLASGLSAGSTVTLDRDWAKTCSVSEFSPEDSWSGRRAMQRNSTIAALSDRVVIAAAGTTGGTWEMGQMCLKRKKPLFVFDLDHALAPGNCRLIRAGAIPLATDGLSVCLSDGDADGPMTLF
jgi:DNA processing protein